MYLETRVHKHIKHSKRLVLPVGPLLQQSSVDAFTTKEYAAAPGKTPHLNTRALPGLTSLQNSPRSLAQLRSRLGRSSMRSDSVVSRISSSRRQASDSSPRWLRRHACTPPLLPGGVGEQHLAPCVPCDQLQSYHCQSRPGSWLKQPKGSCSGGETHKQERHAAPRRTRLDVLAELLHVAAAGGRQDDVVVEVLNLGVVCCRVGVQCA